MLRDIQVIIPTGATRLHPGDAVYFLGDAQVLGELFAALGREGASIRRILMLGGGRISTYVLEQLTERRPGRLGLVAALMRRMRSRGQGPLTVIEQDVDKCKALAERFPRIRVLHADISDEETLLEEELSSYDLAAALTGNQELNLVTAVQAKLLGARRAIALVIKNNYLRLARSVQVDVTVSLKETVVREGTTLLPEGSLTLHTGDQLGVLTRKRHIGKLEARFGKHP